MILAVIYAACLAEVKWFSLSQPIQSLRILQKNIFSIKNPEHAQFLEVMRNLPQYDKLGLGNLAEFTNPINNQGFENKGNKLVNALGKMIARLYLYLDKIKTQWIVNTSFERIQW